MKMQKGSIKWQQRYLQNEVIFSSFLQNDSKNFEFPGHFQQIYPIQSGNAKKIKLYQLCLSKTNQLKDEVT